MSLNFCKVDNMYINSGLAVLDVQCFIDMFAFDQNVL